MPRRALRLVPDLAWYVMLGLLPLTSLPLMSRVVGGAMVMPPSGLVLFFLVAAWLLPALARRMAFPPQAKPLLAFVLAAVLSSLLAYFLPIPPFKDQNFSLHMLQAGLTLGVGVCMYLVVACYPKDRRALRWTLAMIDASGLALIAWSLAQAFFWYTRHDYPLWMVEIQGYLSVTRLFAQRVTGLAFEPSWLAHQLNMLYLPLWMASSAQRFSAFGVRILGRASHPAEGRASGIIVEDLLLVGGLAVLGLSISRVGWLSALLMVCYLLLRGNLWLIRKIKGWIERQGRRSTRISWLSGSLLTGILLVALLAFYSALFWGTGVVLSRADPRMGQLFNLSTLREEGFSAYANQLQFAERVVFWQTGWEVFNDYPLLGVGLGNTGYFFPEKMSSLGWALTEVNQNIFKATGIPNSKSMWSRLLAETGLAGFALFLTWGLFLWFTGGQLSGQGSSKIYPTLGLAVQLMLIGFLAEGFSIDSFALPYIWVSAGLATAAWRIQRLEQRNPAP